MSFLALLVLRWPQKLSAANPKAEIQPAPVNEFLKSCGNVCDHPTCPEMSQKPPTYRCETTVLIVRNNSERSM